MIILKETNSVVAYKFILIAKKKPTSSYRVSYEFFFSWYNIMPILFSNAIIRQQVSAKYCNGGHV